MENCRRAIEAIVADGRNRLVQCSSFYHTEPVGKKDQDWFVNGVAHGGDLLRNPGIVLPSCRSKNHGAGARGTLGAPGHRPGYSFLWVRRLSTRRICRSPTPGSTSVGSSSFPFGRSLPILKHPRLGKTISQILAQCKEEKKFFPSQESEDMSRLILHHYFGGGLYWVVKTRPLSRRKGKSPTERRRKRWSRTRSASVIFPKANLSLSLQRKAALLLQRRMLSEVFSLPFPGPAKN